MDLGLHKRTATTPSTDPPSPFHHYKPRSPTPARAAELPSSTPSNACTSAPAPPEFALSDIVAEVQASGGSFERQTIYRCLRRLTDHEPAAHHDLEDLSNDQLRRLM